MYPSYLGFCTPDSLNFNQVHLLVISLSLFYLLVRLNEDHQRIDKGLDGTHTTHHI